MCIRDSFSDGKRCFLPKVLSVKDHSMEMHEALSTEDISQFAPGAYQIPEPPEGRMEALEEGSQLDLIIVPGLAFDRAGGRLGQGAGFYDRYLERLQETGGRVPLVGVTLDELMVEQAPRDGVDVLMDVVLWPSK
eukprot:TRINITY_DN27367_c0_g1_i1.p1 TRINITY_DN27367_c0_g1~~TRINITY_DN27367_c0_g1_i1.p1  ORF type:complete len:135 (+),score=37.74 TRINITY_DN27367_c0_g1_i1:116-520(+)